MNEPNPALPPEIDQLPRVRPLFNRDALIEVLKRRPHLKRPAAAQAALESLLNNPVMMDMYLRQAMQALTGVIITASREVDWAQVQATVMTNVVRDAVMWADQLSAALEYIPPYAGLATPLVRENPPAAAPPKIVT